MDEYTEFSERHHGPCMARADKRSAFDWSYHGPQFWGVNRCLSMILEHEKAHPPLRYAYAARVRPDGAFDANLTRAIQASVTRVVPKDTGAKLSEEAHVWMRGDSFAVMTRPVLEPYADIWTRCVP